MRVEKFANGGELRRRDGRGMHRGVDIVFLVGWIAFWGYWLVASTGVKPGSHRWASFAGFRVGIILIVLLLLRLGVLKGQRSAATDPLLWGIGLAAFVLGLALAVWARVYLAGNWGMPMTQKADPELVTTGPYRRVRHPIYSGIILAMIGTAIAVSLYWLVAVVVIGAYFIYSAVMEERYMTERLPDSYPGYQRSSKMLIPFIF
jgi:protein-S-isoprenylcysteine O-methyltransferase Ste14